MQVFEFATRDLAQEIDDRRRDSNPFTALHINFVVRQLFRALSFTHRWFFHRDIKPDNIMCNEACTLIKLIDFGQARRTRSK
jgi:serine/threonine protein kinase